ncbi:uncharacterized protein LOC116114685 [Pistacia vera]|uniref:uncharacterized protein LOC116114685 n=1 Tax=Pistacia vera TaxID=55513 RepID=UPI0012638E0C|nr:uncharacterized protein LOC116114685 [Pistacia vera]
MASEGISSVSIWVKFNGVPLEFWTAKGLSYVASAIGKPLYMDNIMDTGDRLEYARVCVEIDTASSFPNSVELGLLNGMSLTQVWRMVTKRKENVLKDVVVQAENVGKSSSRKKEQPINKSRVMVSKTKPSTNQFVVLSSGNRLDNWELDGEEGSENVEDRFGKDKDEMSGVNVPRGADLNRGNNRGARDDWGKCVKGNEYGVSIPNIEERRLEVSKRLNALSAGDNGREVTPPRVPLVENNEGCEMGSTSLAIVRFGNLIRVDEKEGLKEGNISLSKSQRRRLAKKAREVPSAQPSHD